jgi:hypothetical protein
LQKLNKKGDKKTVQKVALLGFHIDNLIRGNFVGYYWKIEHQKHRDEKLR